MAVTFPLTKREMQDLLMEHYRVELAALGLEHSTELRALFTAGFLFGSNIGIDQFKANYKNLIDREGRWS